MELLLKKVIKATSKNYQKLINKGIFPLFPVFKISHNVKYLVIDKNNEYFSYSETKPN